LVKSLANEMRQHLRIRLGFESMAPLLELLSERLVIFNHSIVNKIKATGFVTVRVGVFTRYRTMGGPAGMADAGMALNGGFFNQRSKVGDMTDRFTHIDAPWICYRDTC
jgi:hypothetical protein